MASIKSISLPDGTSYDFKDEVSGYIKDTGVYGIYYGTCATAAATAAKVATLANSDGFSLTKGATVAIKFTYSNTVANPTLNVDGSGAKSIKRYGTTAPSTSTASSWNANSVLILVYDGTYWQLASWINTTYSAMSVAEYEAGTSGTARLISPVNLKNAIHLWATGEANVQSDWNQTDDTADDYIKNKPSIPSGVSPYTSNPSMDGTASAGSSNLFSRGDHVHPSDTSRVPTTRKINGQELSSDVTLNGSQIPLKSTGNLTIAIAVDNKVDKETGKGLSTNDYTTAEQTKLAGIASGAEVNVQANWNESDSTSDAYIQNKPEMSNYLLTNNLGAEINDNVSKNTWAVVVNGSVAMLYVGNGIASFQTFVGRAMYGLETLWAQILNGVSDLSTAQARLFTITEVDMPNAKVRMTSVDNGTVYTVDLQDTGGGLIGTISSQTIPTGGITTETDPTVPAWAKESTKPTYTASEVGAASSSHSHGNLTNAGILSNSVSVASGDQLVITDHSASGKLTPATISFGSSTTTFLANDGSWRTPSGGGGGGITTETDPTVPSWAKEPTKPSYTASEVGALATTGGQLTGDLTLYVASGNSPGLIFQRGTLTDNYNDWKIYDKSGYLYFAQRGSGSSAFGDIGYIDTGGVLRNFTIPWGSVSGKPTIPTKTSDLTNDSGYISEPTMQTLSVTSGGSGTWYYRTWPSGWQEAWYQGSIQFTTAASSAGGWYRSTKNFALPISFADDASILVSGATSGRVFTHGGIKTNGTQFEAQILGGAALAANTYAGWNVYIAGYGRS